MVDEQFIAASVAAYPADRGRVFVFNRGTGQSDVLEMPLFDILRLADRFNTLSGHVRRLLATGWEDDGSGFLESAYRELVDRGLLVPKSALHKCILDKGGGSPSPPPVTSLVIPTRDRIPQLQRCVGGFLENIEKQGHKMDYLVFDDSRKEGQGEKARSALAPLGSAEARVFYSGKEEKLAFLNELVREASAEGLPKSVLEFCLFGNGGDVPTYGANRNAALLATGGELVIMTDDDTVHEPVDIGTREKASRLTSQLDPTILKFYADRRRLLAAVHPSEIDIVSCHERLLGRSILECRTSLGPDCFLDVEQIGPGFASSVCRMPMTVRATMAGFWGDCGMGSPNAVVELRGESRDLVMHSKAEYLMATDSREVFRGVSQYAVSDGTLFMTANSGVDNRTILPPFFPVGRNEDGIFATTLRACAEDALIGHLPMALYHAPDEVRGWPKGAFLNVTPRLADIVISIIRSFTPSIGVRGVSKKLSALGQHFADFGALKMDDFEDQIKAVWLATVSHYIANLEDLLDLYHGQPDYWAKDVLSMVGDFKDLVTQGSPVVLREFSEFQPVEQAKESCRRLVREFGELLQWWPVIYDAAKRLKEDGIRLVRPV